MNHVYEQTEANPSELTLDKAERGHSYIILSSSATDRNRMRMDSLGLIPGDVVHVLYSNFAGLVIAIKGSRLAIGRPLASLLAIKEFHDEDWQSDGTA